MALTEQEKQALYSRFSRLNGLDIAHILVEANEAGLIDDARVRGFAQRVWAAWTAQRRAIIEAQIADLQTEREGLE